MRYLFIILLLLNATLYANPLNNAYSKITQEYKEFRTYPRINKAQVLIDDKKETEAKVLLLKALEIDKDNKRAINLLLHICIKEHDTVCIEKYAHQSKSAEVGYFYKDKAQKEIEKENYKGAIKFSKKALKYKIKSSDRKFINLMLFKSYLKSNQYSEADKIIDKENSDLYNLFRWSKISHNIKEKEYAYSLAKELPNKLKYLKWKIELLIELKNYTQASKELEMLNKIEASKENHDQLLYMYSLTGQNSKILETYQKKLKKGCDRYALKALLHYHRHNKRRKLSILEKTYPFSCLKSKERINLSLELITLLKVRKPKKAKKIAQEISPKIKDKTALLNLYQDIGQKDKLVEIQKNSLKRGCDKKALYFLLDYYKNNKDRKKVLLTHAYPYSCLSLKKRTTLSFELISLLDEKKDKHKIENIINSIDKRKHYLYLSNLESSLENYNKTIEYAENYLKIYPNNPEAIKNIGYAYFKLGQKNTAQRYLIKASKLDPKDYALLKNIGYLAIELKNHNVAIKYWHQYIEKNRDKEIALELASLYFYKLHDYKSTNKILNLYKRWSKSYSEEYYVLKAKLAYKGKNCQKSLKYYSKALEIKKVEYLQYEQVHLFKECKQNAKAVELMEKLVKTYPTKISYQKELAYMYGENKNYPKAIDKLKKIKDSEPKKVENYTTLAYTYKKVGQKKRAIDTFKEAIDKSENIDNFQQKNIKREITNLSKDFHFYSVQSLRLNAYKEHGNLSPVNSASYNGFGNMQLTYQPRFLPKNTTLYANISHNHKNITKSIQPSIGVRYKPLKDKKIYLSAEQLIKTNKHTRSDMLLRASLGISGEPHDSTHEELYLEGAHFAKANSNILYGNYEFGKKYNVGEGISITPYLTTGATYNNDNTQKQSVTNMDIGAGVAVDILSGESRYEIEKYRNRLKLEARQKYAGNSKDKQALRLQWEFFY